MNAMEDPMTVVSDLRPSGLDRLAEETYAQRRGDDLARVLGEPASGAGPPAPRAPAYSGPVSS